MGRYFVDIAPTARKELQKHYKSGDKAVIRKIEKILFELSETPFTGEGKPEQLKYDIAATGQEELTKKTVLFTVLSRK